jgi:hypothetical protein
MVEASKINKLFLLFAEDKGFEPLEQLSSTVFKTAAIDLSANLLYSILRIFKNLTISIKK